MRFQDLYKGEADHSDILPTSPSGVAAVASIWASKLVVTDGGGGGGGGGGTYIRTCTVHSGSGRAQPPISMRFSREILREFSLKLFVRSVRFVGLVT